jgi:hypothetical protein
MVRHGAGPGSGGRLRNLECLGAAVASQLPEVRIVDRMRTINTKIIIGLCSIMSVMSN